MRYMVTLAVGVGLMAYIELPGMIKNKMTKELTVWLVLIILGAILTFFYAILNVDYAVLTDLLIRVFSGGNS